MGARRSKTGRTAALLPLGTRRPPATSTLLLSCALLVAIGSGSAQGFAPRGAAPHVGRVSSHKVAGSASTAPGTHEADIAGLSATNIPTSVAAAHGPQLRPRPPLRHARHKRAVVASNQDDASRANDSGLAALPADDGSGPSIGSPIDDGAGVAFITHASRSSRTRGQPASDC